MIVHLDKSRCRKGGILSEVITPNSDSKVTNPRKSRATRNILKMIVDAGNGRIKCHALGYTSCVDSIVCTVAEASSWGLMGAFEWNDQNYIVGHDAPNAKTRTIISRTENGKIKFFPHMVLGAITSHPYILDSVIGKGKKRKLVADIQCLSIARGESLYSNLQKASQFSVNGMIYEIEWRSFISYPEGFGAALSAHKIIKEKNPKAERFYTLDIGNGTITLTPYECLGKKPIAGTPFIGSGGGVSSIVRFFGMAAMYGDDGESVASLDYIRTALQRAEVLTTEDGQKRYSTFAAISRRDIGDCLYKALMDWRDKHVSAQTILQAVDDVLLGGHYVFCCGGGFEVAPVADFIQQQMISERLIVLPTPGTISLTGLEDHQ